MTGLLTPFTDNPFLLRSLLAGLLVAISGSIAGTFVVLRGMAFLGDALAHGVLPGVAGALLLGVPGTAGALVGAAVMVAGVNVVTAHTRLSRDTAIGLLFVGMLGLGVVMVSRSDSFSGDIVGILFGEILGISADDLLTETLAALAIGALAVLFARPFLLLAFDPEQAELAGWPRRRFELLMLTMVTLSVVMSFRTVGTLLVFGMLLAPAGTGALLARSVTGMMTWGVLVGSASVYAGLLASYYADVAAGATIVVIAVVVFFVVMTAQGAWRAIQAYRGGPREVAP
jgi:ABC-type Mn2+/Zn2+ transport system permease subunit